MKKSPQKKSTAKKSPSTSWGKVHAWYDEYLQKEDTYQSKVLLPNLIRVLALQKNERVLDLACGQGFFTHAFAKEGAQATGVDIAVQLITRAKKLADGAVFEVAPASKLHFADNASFDIVVCVLALQNIENIADVFKEVRRVLTPSGRFVIVLNHPAFRVLKRSSWGWDENSNIQYRRIDGYASAAKVSVNMHPGSKTEINTISYHRSLQDFSKALFSLGFAITKLEEWISHRASQTGARQKAEDSARKEIPLFMMLEATRMRSQV